MGPNLLAAKAGIFFSAGDRVQLSPATDAWMRGDRYGEVLGFIRGRKHGIRYRVRLDKSGRVAVLPASLLSLV
jgi:hypothetical protein